jgi:hypothetical protein
MVSERSLVRLLEQSGPVKDISGDISRPPPHPQTLAGQTEKARHHRRATARPESFGASYNQVDPRCTTHCPAPTPSRLTRPVCLETATPEQPERGSVMTPDHPSSLCGQRIARPVIEVDLAEAGFNQPVSQLHSNEHPYRERQPPRAPVAHKYSIRLGPAAHGVSGLPSTARTPATLFAK